MKKKLIYSGIAGMVALGIYLLISTTHTGILQDNVKAIADENVRIPCISEGMKCQFIIESTEEAAENTEQGIATIKNMKNVK